jgi:hypothetical protein
VKTFNAVIGGRAILEKDERATPERATMKLVAPWRTSVGAQLDEAESGGYPLAAMDSPRSTLWIKYPERAEAGYSYYVLGVGEANNKTRAEGPFAGEALEIFSFVQN